MWGDEMEQIKVPLHLCASGEIIAQDAFNNNGTILVRKDTPMNDYIRERLLMWGQTQVSIYTHEPNEALYETDKEEQVKESYVTALRSQKNIIENLSSGKRVDYKEFLVISNLIFDNINDSNNIIQYLNEVKGYDDYTYTHGINTSFYCMLITKWMRMSDHELKTAIQAGLLHDIGKADIPKQVLNKKEILTREEYEIIKQHTIYGYNKLVALDNNNLISEEVRKSILLHHERIDGSGYPYHSKAEDINFFARIVSVADVFDAMTSDRIYKKRSSPFDAFEMFKTVGIGMFDPEIVNNFLKNIALYYTDAKVLLSDGRVGNVVYIPPQDITRPIVKVELKYLDLAKQKEIKLLRVI